MDTRVEHRLSNAAKAFLSSSSSAFHGKLGCGGAPHNAVPCIATGGPGSQARAFFAFLGSSRSTTEDAIATAGTPRSKLCGLWKPHDVPCSTESTEDGSGGGLVPVLPPSLLASCAFNLWSMACMARSMGPNTSSAEAGDRCTAGLGVANRSGGTRAGEGVRGRPAGRLASATAGAAVLVVSACRTGDDTLPGWLGDLGCCWGRPGLTLRPGLADPPPLIWACAG
mmetsp:Transcript_53207/g.114071  ORF Transcript_53207/g.114071 Transcript_53207/m.114071 type:complete len:225 (-) Transcript_53207:934-1608(-)